jgi:hypothetical protein
MDRDGLTRELECSPELSQEREDRLECHRARVLGGALPVCLFVLELLRRGIGEGGVQALAIVGGLDELAEA